MPNKNNAFIPTLKLPLVLAISAILLAACSGASKTTQSNTSTVIGASDTYENVGNQTAATGSEILDDETLAILDDLLSARDMSMVEGDRIQVERYGNLWDRIRRGYKITQPAYNPRIEAQKAWFSSRQSYLNSLTARASRYLHHTVTEAERRGIPVELALLPIIESSYDPAATSNAAAAGLWQFIPSTGRIYGLTQTSTYDGRRDVIESTRAAYDFLTSLYNQFGSWELALAAYNAGPGRVQRAINANVAQGLPTDYWSLRLPTETMNYVPRFMAVAQIIGNPSAQGISLPAIANHAHFRAVPINQGVSLSEISVVTGVPVYELQLLNPALLNLRVESAAPSRILIPNSVPVQLNASLSSLSGYGQGQTRTTTNFEYIVPNSGGQGSLISTTELRQTNTLPTTSATVTANKTIIQEPPLSQEERQFIASQIAQSTQAPVQPISPADGNIELEAVQTAQSVLDARGQTKTLNYTNTENATYTPQPVQPSYTPPTHTTAAPRPSTNTSSAKPTTYTVKRGDTLTAIAQNYGVSVTQLREWNNLQPSDTLKAGTRLSLVATTAKPTTSKATSAATSTPQSHIVQAGETLTSIAQKYQLTIGDLAAYNDISTTTRVQRGQKLWLVAGKTTQNTQSKATYRVQAGDTLTSIANKYNMSVTQLAALNNMSPADPLVRGKVLSVQGTANSSANNTKTNTNTNTASTAKTEEYKVRSGESLTSIAGQYNMSAAELARLNNLPNNARLITGSVIKVPKLTTTHTVRSGETLNALAKRYGISTAELAQMNGLNANAKLQRGQKLTVPNR